jgi:Cu+-exporting ATPase
MMLTLFCVLQVCGFELNHILKVLLVTPVQFGVGLRFHIGAIKSLRHGAANMDVLVALGTNAAYVYSMVSILTSAVSPHIQGTSKEHSVNIQGTSREHSGCDPRCPS